MNNLLIDLAAASVGSTVLEASDEFFGPKGRLVLDEAPVADPQRSAKHGVWMDGWETRRRRSPGHDWAIVRLGLRGVIRTVQVDTTHFTGSHPDTCAVEAIDMPGSPNIVDLVRARDRWIELLPRLPAEPDSLNEYNVAGSGPVSHVRLVVYPDGGVARLRCFGDPVPPDGLLDGTTPVDLAAISSGARVIDCSDAHFASPNQMLANGRPNGPRDGWLSRRRRSTGSDWALIRLAGIGRIERIAIDTSQFTGTAPGALSVEAALAGPESHPAAFPWVPLLERTEVEEDQRQEFTELHDVGDVSHLRLSIHPDGGIGRFRAYGVSGRAWIDPV
ncbi:allantoicase [bacterium]|nr:allantoicase [bacterium]